ncbi:MAG: Zn-dependent hydrolase [Rhodothermales bacterium]|nr:Zn-dependent hydrolase [Rhodothermales bacterium]
MIRLLSVFLIASFFAAGCDSNDPASNETEDKMPEPEVIAAAALVDKYTEFRLEADLTNLSESEKAMLSLLIDAADHMDDIFWKQSYGSRDSLLESIKDPDLRTFARINYGPWDRLDDNKPFVEGIGAKPAGAQFYPADITVEELMGAAEQDSTLVDLYTVVRRDSLGMLYSVPYHVEYNDEMSAAAARLRDASALATDEGFARYLNSRADALLSGEYQQSDMDWMDMKSNRFDVVIGPIEVYEDELRGFKAGAEAYVLIKDLEWSDRLSHYAGLLPALQAQLPVDSTYKQESPGTDSDLNAYDAVYFAGDANAGSKTIAINLPNDEVVQQEKGSRRLQLKNAMRAKFDKILVPISNVLIAPEQQANVTFNAFFENVMFHEVAHGLGIKETINGKGTVREALAETYSSIEEGKADILGLFMVTQLHEMGELDSDDLMDNYVTFMAGIFRSVRFGASSAHGRANMIRFNFFEEKGAFERDSTGVYRVEFDAMKSAMNDLSRMILMLQGDGDYEGTARLISGYGIVKKQLANDLERLNDEGIPVDIVFRQGKGVLGLN